MIPLVIQMKIAKQYEGQTLKRALYAMEVANGYYECQAIYHKARKCIQK